MYISINIRIYVYSLSVSHNANISQTRHWSIQLNKICMKEASVQRLFQPSTLRSRSQIQTSKPRMHQTHTISTPDLGFYSILIRYCTMRYCCDELVQTMSCCNNLMKECRRDEGIHTIITINYSSYSVLTLRVLI